MPKAGISILKARYSGHLIQDDNEDGRQQREEASF